MECIKERCMFDYVFNYINDRDPDLVGEAIKSYYENEVHCKMNIAKGAVTGSER
jgi:hypothetical protein